MEIVVCVKPVPDPETRLKPSPDQRALDTEGVKFVLAGYDESAVEQALLLRDQVTGTTVRAVAYGPAPRTPEILRSCLALGCDAVTHIEAPGPVDDPMAVAAALGHVLAPRPAELILLGKQALDDEEGLIAPALGALLQRPSFSSVTDLRWSPERSRFTFQRSTDTAIERWEASPPLVVGLQQAWNDPRTAKLPNILKARRQPIETVPASAITAAVEGRTGRSLPLRFDLPAPRAGARMIDYTTPDEAAERLVRILREEAKVFP